MRNKLLKIARYLGQNGFYKEAANLKKLAEAESDTDVLERSDREDKAKGWRGREFFHGEDKHLNPGSDPDHPSAVMAHPYTKKEIEDPFAAWAARKSPAAWPQELQPGIFGYLPAGRISGAFFLWCKEKGLDPNETSLGTFLNTEHPMKNLPGSGKVGGQIPEKYWKKIKDLVREHPLFEGAELEPHLERAISETGPDGGFNWAMDGEDGEV